MKKTMLILAATVAMGTAAFAQDTTGTTAAPQTPDASAPATTPTDTTTTAPGQPGTMGTPDQSMGATPPATDPNQGQMATPPATDQGGMTPPPSTGAMQPTQATGDYPACGRGVTDKCVQKGGSGKAMSHRRAHHRKK